jgi:O-antigen ligase
LEGLQLLACNAVIVAYFLAFIKYKTWYIAAAAALVFTAFLVAAGAVRIHGVLSDLWPIVLYFVYLFLASFQSEYGPEARHWAIADSIGILVFALFWIAGRNNDAATIRKGFVQTSYLAIASAVLVYYVEPQYSRLGAYALPFYPVAIPFLWAEIIDRRARSAWLALVLVLANLVLSRSRTPLAAGLLGLGLSFLWIGRNVAQRVKLGVVMLVCVVALGAAFMSFPTTRYFLYVFVSRITHEDVLTQEFYIPGEPFDPTRSNLNEIVSNGFRDAQPFGVGYNTVGYVYERAFGFYTPLHSIYQTWIFEGGLFCALIVAGILIRHWLALRAARRRSARPEEAVLARCLMFSTVAMLFIGLFHQMHQGPLFYAILGMSLGFRKRILAELVSGRRP